MKSLSPLPKLAFLIDGAPAVGAKLFTYLSGTTTKTDTWTDQAGMTANTNPIILDSRGECEVWIDNAIAYTYTLSPPTDTDPPTNPIWTVDGINTTTSPLVVTDAGTPALQLLDGSGNGVQIGYSVGDGLLEISQVLANVVGSPVFTVDPVPQSTATIHTADPLTLSSDSSIDIDAGSTLSIAAGTSLTLASTTTMALNASANLSLTSSGGEILVGTLGSLLSIGGFVWPAADGTSGQFLATDGAGNLSFASGPGSGSFAQTGKVLLASRLLLQWTVIHVGDITAGSTTTWTFGQEFTGGVFSVVHALQTTTGFGGVPTQFLTSLSTTAAVFTWYEDFSVTEDIYLHAWALGAPS